MNTQHPLVSIIIPTFNRAHLIGETLDSVLVQTYQNWECIIVDDGSTDNTDKVVGDYVKKDPRFKYYHRPDTHKSGGNGARNYGFEVSKGEYIQWFDSDDLMMESKIEIKMIEALKVKADVVIDSHSTSNPKINKNDVAAATHTFESATFYKDFILGKHPVITNDVMVKRSVIGQIRFDENLHKAQEFDYFARVFKQHLVYVFIDLSLTYYRIDYNLPSKRPLIKKSESLIYLSKKLIKEFSDDKEIVERAKRQGRKTYKSLAKKRKLKMLLKHFSFFKSVHEKSGLSFFMLMVYNVITARGFYKIKPCTT